MKHVRGDLIALLAVVALALAGEREATAGPCKADGQRCRTSRSCCGTSGNNGVCVKASGAKFGVCCTPDCTGKDCGDDECGGSCGTCTAPGTCISGTCCGNGVVEGSEECDSPDLAQCGLSNLSCGPPGFSTACRCCSYGGPNTQIVGCCNPFSILIPAPDFSGSCVATRCDPPFACSGTDRCQPDHTCCTTGTCIVTPLGSPFGLNACCPGLECRGADVYGFGCCVPDGGACTGDADCCTMHCGGSGTCDACRPGGAACTGPFECCSLSCDGSGTCNVCAPAGLPCLSGATCCSESCNSFTLTCDP